MEGSGYFDIRDARDRWIRILVTPGQMIILPEGSYHRFTTDSNNFIKAMRLFVGAPIWTPYNRDTISESNPSRAKYVNNFLINILHKESPEYVETAEDIFTRELVCELCRLFFTAGWVMGTGGSISIRHGPRIYMTPSGVQKERIQPQDLFVLNVDGAVLATPTPALNKPAPKLSDCSPLFLHAFKQRNAGGSTDPCNSLSI